MADKDLLEIVAASAGKDLPSLWDMFIALPAVLLDYLAIALIAFDFGAISRKVKTLTSIEAGGAKFSFAAHGS